jgi:serine/threonine-protein kinase HipA
MYASAQTLLRMDNDGASYLDLVRIIESQGARGCVGSDLEQLFRRAAFNVLIGNRDDHLRNHGFLREASGWKLAPAFDVNPNPEKDHHVLTLDGRETTPDTRLLAQSREFFRLGAQKAENALEEVRVAVRLWRKRAKALGVKSSEIETLGGVIDPER